MLEIRKWCMALCAVACSVTAITVRSEPALRSWAPQDSIPIRYFYNYTSTSWWGVGVGQLPVDVAPGGEYFLVMSTHAELDCDCTVSEVLIYSVKDVTSALRAKGASRQKAVSPFRRIRMSSTADGIRQGSGAIAWPSWDSPASFLFQGTGDRGKFMSLYRFDVRSGELTLLSGDARNVSTFDKRGESLIFTTVDVSSMPRDDQDVPKGSQAYPVLPMRRNAIAAFLNNWFSVRSMATYAVRGKGDPWIVQPATSPPPRTPLPAGPALSPDGKWAVAILPSEEQDAMPDSWHGYTGLDLPVDELLTRDRERLWQFVLVDMTTGHARPMLSAPLGPQGQRRGSRAFWSADSERVVLFNTMLPLNVAAPERRDTPYIVEYTVRTGEWSELAPVSDSSEAWLARSGKSRELEKRDATPRPALPAGLTVLIRESANDPPVIVASLGKREVALTDADPALEGLRRVDVKEVAWVERDGLEEKGGLLLPDGVRGPLPLVIQLEARVHPTAPLSLFRPDGASSTAFAAQALAAQGIAVLQVGGDPSPKYPALVKSQPWMEASLMTERIDAAVSKLAADGIVDPRRVGLVGFSRTGFRVNYVITHPGKIIPAAAIVADAVTNDYTDAAIFRAFSSGESRGAVGEALYGGPFWEHKQRWLEHAPGFNVDRVETPALFTYNQFHGAYCPFIETLAAFRANGREIDLMLFPAGGHQLQRPKQRLASMQATVDWMTFWLQGREDAKPAKAAQYRYWRALRAQKLAREADANAKGSTH
jgi:dienelactone hydrolase